MKKAFLVWKRVFKNWKYIVIILLVAFIFYTLNGLIINIGNIGSFYTALGFSATVKTVSLLSLRFFERVTLFSTITTILLSLLLGVLISLLIYRFDIMKTQKVEKAGWFGTLGLFLGVAAPGCAACGVGLLSVLGLASVLTVLPFQGNEVNVIAIIIVSFAIFQISGKLYNPICQLNFNDTQVKGGLKNNGRKQT